LTNAEGLIWNDASLDELSVVVATLIFTVSANAQPPLDLQATCAAQARKAFNEFEREWKNDPAKRMRLAIISGSPTT